MRNCFHLLINCTTLILAGMMPAVAAEQFAIETRHAVYTIQDDGFLVGLTDRRDGGSRLKADRGAPFCFAGTADHWYASAAATWKDKTITLKFDQIDATITLEAVPQKDYLVLKVVDVGGKDIETVHAVKFANAEIRKPDDADDAFVCTSLALNLSTNASQVPGAGSQMDGVCYRKFGFVGAEVALVACPKDQMRRILQQVITDAPALPKSHSGGPWAQDDPRTRGSYLFNFTDCTEDTVDDWIKLAKQLGFTQIDFHGGGSFRFGDCRPNPTLYPNGFASLKAVIDKLHENGILAGLHTYAFFVAKDSPWVTPIPDPRLLKNGRYTLSNNLPADGATVFVDEPLDGRSTDVGFFSRHSVTVQIGDELIVYKGLINEKPYAFTECQRGAHGTTVAAHEAGSVVHHLDQMFHLFSPDGDTDMLEEVAGKTAEAYNACGFDMMYLDALDGEYILSAEGFGWHYGAKFVHELVKSVDRDPIMEMSTFYHHLWCVRSRMGAWDHPNFSHKRFIDHHIAANLGSTKMFLPGHMGWWAVKTWNGLQAEPTFSDDIAYLCGKCIGLDMGLSIMGVDPNTINTTPALPRLAGIMRQYEAVRHAGVDEEIKAELAVPGKEFELLHDDNGEPCFRRAHYDRHKVCGLDGWSDAWTVENPYAEQKPQLRIEALFSSAPYDSPEAVVLVDFKDTSTFTETSASEGTTIDLVSSDKHAEHGTAGALTATAGKQAAWAQVGTIWEPGRNLTGHEAIGVWVYGDGQGELLNIQTQSPDHVSRGIAEHYIDVDFTGWRYFELLEPDAERWAHFTWPYGHPYLIYRETVEYHDVERLDLWYNDLPPDRPVTSHLSPIKALPLVEATIKSPTVIINGKPLTFPVDMKTGSYLELDADGRALLYGPKGETLKTVRPEGSWETIGSGQNKLQFTCDTEPDVQPRVRVTVKLLGDRLKPQ